MLTEIIIYVLFLVISLFRKILKNDSNIPSLYSGGNADNKHYAIVKYNSNLLKYNYSESVKDTANSAPHKEIADMIQYKEKLQTMLNLSEEEKKVYLNISEKYFNRFSDLTPHPDFLMDAQGWYSIMANGAVKTMIEKFNSIIESSDIIYDFFAGCGGSAYGLAKSFPSKKVIAIELDPIRHRLLSHNLKDVPNAIAICDSVWNHKNIQCNSVIYMSPPWENSKHYTQNNMKNMMVGELSAFDWTLVCLKSKPTLLILHLPRKMKINDSFYNVSGYNKTWYMIQRPDSPGHHPIDSLLLVYTKVAGT
jgi:hypothetical protein